MSLASDRSYGSGFADEVALMEQVLIRGRSKSQKDRAK